MNAWDRLKCEHPDESIDRHGIEQRCTACGGDVAPRTGRWVLKLSSVKVLPEEARYIKTMMRRCNHCGHIILLHPESDDDLRRGPCVVEGCECGLKFEGDFV